MRTNPARRARLAARKSQTRALHFAALAAAALFVAFCATVLPVAMATGSSQGQEPAVSGASASPRSISSASPEPTVVTCTVAPAATLYGDTVTVAGTVGPALAGEQVAVSLDTAALGTATTDATGAYTLSFVARRSGAVTAQLVGDGTLSTAQPLVVRPKVTITHGTPVPFLTLPFVVTVAPSSYTGTITAVVVHRGVKVATAKAVVHSGKATLQIPLRGIDWFNVSFTVPAGDGLAKRTVARTVRARWVRIARGSKGPRVRGLLTALKRLKIRVPYIGTTFNVQCGDAAVAFQKAYRLPRTYVFDGDDWRKLDVAKTIKPRHASPAVHIEVDKGRQILMVVKNGAVYGLIAVSTGRTGNTPEGSFRIQQKHPYTTSGYGGILFRTMGFYKDFAIHGYSPVPPYPASHGCVREPMWVADWTYNQSWVGERLYIYH